MTPHALITWLITQWSRGWSCTDHEADHTLITWLCMHWARGWTCNDHVAYHADQVAIMPWFRGWSCTVKEAEKIKKRWQEYTEELNQKHLNDLHNHDGVVTNFEPDILECEVKWALGSITMNRASGSDSIPAELFQILKDNAVKVLHSMCQQIWSTQQWPQDWKKSVFIIIPKKDSAEECSNYCTTALISHANKVMLKKILQARPEQHVNQESRCTSWI